MAGVSEAVTAPPSCAPMFVKPETEPEKAPPISALTDQKELCERYSAPAPPARITLARRALPTLEPKARKTPARAIPATATPQRPQRRPLRRVSQSLSTPPSRQPIAIARTYSVTQNTLSLT